MKLNWVECCQHTNVVGGKIYHQPKLDGNLVKIVKVVNFTNLRIKKILSGDECVGSVDGIRGGVPPIPIRQ